MLVASSAVGRGGGDSPTDAEARLDGLVYQAIQPRTLRKVALEGHASLFAQALAAVGAEGTPPARQGVIDRARDRLSDRRCRSWLHPPSAPPPFMAPATELPQMEPYARHVLVCTGGFCSDDRRGRALYSRLAYLLQREGLLFGPQRVKRSEAPCLGVCNGGPIVAVYPEGVWYGHVTPELLERIVMEHLKGGRVIESAVFHRLGHATAGAASETRD